MRADTFGYLQRSFPGFTSATDVAEARLVGTKAVEYSADAANAEGSVAMRRTGGERYAVETFLTPLKTVAKETKHMAAEYLRNGNDVTDAFIAYAHPLVGPLPAVGVLDELKK